MSEIVVAPHIATVPQASLDPAGDHCEAALSLSGCASSDISAHSSGSDNMQHFSGVPCTYPDQAPGVSSKVASDAQRREPQSAPLPRCTSLQTQMHLRVIVAGASNLGKTRFIDDLKQALERKWSSTEYGEDSSWKRSSKAFAAHRAASLGRSAFLSMTLDLYPDELTVHMGPLELPGLPDRALNISMLDAPAYDVEPSQALYLAKLLEHILWQRVMDYRAMSFRTNSGSQQTSSVLLCLYFLPPREEVSPADLIFMSALSQVVPLAPVISLGPPPAVGKETSAEVERMLDIQGSVIAAMQGYVRNGKSAPIESLEAPSIMPMDGVDLGPRSDVEMFMGLMQTSLDDLIRSDETRFEHFRQLYDACGKDVMCLLWEILDPYHKELHDSVSTTAVATMTSTADDGTIVSEHTNQDSLHTSGKHPAMPPTPEPLVAVKPRGRDVAADTEAAAQDETPSATPASESSSPHAVTPGATYLTSSVQPKGTMAAQDEVDAKAVMPESSVERVVAAIEQIVEKLTLTLSTGQVATQPHIAGTAHDQNVGVANRDPCDAAMVIQETEEHPQAADTYDKDRAVVVQDVVQPVSTALAANATAEEDAAVVRDTVRRAVAVVVRNATERQAAEVVQNTVRRAFTAAITKAEASSEVAVAHGVNNLGFADITQQMPQSLLRGGSAGSGRVPALSALVRQGLAAVYDGLGKARSAAVAACAAVASARSLSVSVPRSTPAPDAKEDVAAIVKGIVRRAITATVAGADTVPKTKTVLAVVAEKEAKDEDVVAALVRRVMIRAVETAEKDSRRKDILQNVHSFLVSRAFYSTSSGSGVHPCIRVNGREAALLRAGSMNMSVGIGVGIGVASIAAGTFVVLVLRHKHSSA